MNKPLKKNCGDSKNHIVKRKSGEKLEGKEKQIIFNVFNYLRTKNPERSISRTVEDTAEATGCSTQTVFRIRKEAENGPFKSPSKTKPRKHMNKNSRLIKYDDYIRSIIRSKVHDCLFKNLPLTLNSVLSIVNDDPELPNFKRSTLHKVLNEMGFNYEKKGKNAMYIEKADLINARHNYLLDIRKLRLEKRYVVYVGETILQDFNKCIGDTDGDMLENNDLYPQNISAMPSEAKSSNKYAVMLAGNENGFVKDGALVYLHNKLLTSENEISERSQFEEWIKNRLLPSLPSSSIILVDNSTLRRWRSDPVPDKTWQRDDIKEWLLGKQVLFKSELLKKDLLDIVLSVKDKLSGYKMEEFVQSHGHTVLRLPMNHYELSPLGVLWVEIKQYLTAQLKSVKVNDFEHVIWEALRSITVKSWQMQMGEVLKVEDRMWRADLLQEAIIKECINTSGVVPIVSSSESKEKSDERDSLPADQAVWFSDFMRLRTGESYHQYYEDRQQNGYEMIK